MKSQYAELIGQRTMALREENIDCTDNEMLVRITHCGLGARHES